MKNIFKLSLLFFSLFLITACEEDSKNPFQVATFENGVVLKTISRPSSSFDLFNLATSKFAVELEFFTGSGAKDNSLLESVDVFVRFRDNTSFNGTNNVPEVALKTVPASAFAVGPTGLPRTVLEVTATEALAALGLTPAQVDGGDIIAVRLLLKLTTGQQFTSTSVSGDVSGGRFFASPFAYDASFVCQLPNTVFVGAYQMTVIEDGDLTAGDAFGVPTYDDQEVNITASSGTRRVIPSLSYLPAFGGFDGPFTFDLVCGRTVVPVQNAGGGVGCGSGSITLGTQGEFGAFDITDESSFTVTFNDFIADGGCGVAPHRVILQFDKL